MRLWIALWVGSSRICTHIAGWLLGGGAWGASGKALLTLTVAGVIKGLPWTTNITVLLALAWLALAVIIGLRAPIIVTIRDQADSDTAQDAPEQPAAPTREELATALHTIGTPHAHISALAEHLDTPSDRVREALAGAHIPISGGVRMKGRPVPVSTGVKQEHFPPLPSPGEEAAQDGVLTSNNNSNNSGEGSAREGMSIIQDEEHPSRWHVLRRART